MEILKKRIIRLIGYILPNYRYFNIILALPLFYMAQKRLPKPWQHKDAAINDFIFHKMTANLWTTAEVDLVDKELAKKIARHNDGGLGVTSTETCDVIKLQNMTQSIFEDKISRYIGQKLVAKPTHGSGTVVFLSAPDARQKLAQLYRAAKRNYFYVNRESQYAGLEKKVIIETDISDEKGKAPDDYKFHCSRGHVIYCQHDLGRFTEHRRAILTVPKFGIMNQEVTFPRPTEAITQPKMWAKMISIAEKLSTNIDYVRIDLYEYNDQVFLGEFTLTPGAGMGDLYKDSKFEKWVLDEVKNRMT